MVEAVAGSGKTTTAVGCARAAKGKVGFVAFNKHIAEELGRRLGGTATATTLHGLGFAAVKKALPGAELDEQKPRRLLERLRPRWMIATKSGRVLWYEEGQATLALARLARLTLTDENCAQSLRRLARHYSVEIPEGAFDQIAKATAELIQGGAEQTAVIDYDDMIWLPSRLGLPVERFDTLLVDEAQDLNQAQQNLARRAADGRRLVVLGDRRQSLYGFTGADPEAMPHLVEDLAADACGAAERPLTVTFRCPHSVVELAQRIVPRIEAAAGAVDGVVRFCAPESAGGEMRPGDLAVCRLNAPLVSLAYRLLRDGTPAVMLGRDFASDLTGLVARSNAKGTVELIAWLREKRDWKLRQLERRDAPESQVQMAVDRYQCLEELASACSSIGELRDNIGRLFAESKDRSKVVTLASVHRAKGSEADRVFVIAPEKMPLEFRKKQQDWEAVQELNLLYVAVTRAKRELVFAGPLPAPLGGC